MRIVDIRQAKDSNTVKYLQKTVDNNVVETGYYNFDEHILCLSTQIGCSMSCIFCASSQSPVNSESKQGFIRNLTATEIVEQAQSILNQHRISTNSKKRILFSYMGTGEPLLNYDNVTRSISRLFRLYPKSRATISTTGIDTKRMRALANEEFSSIVKLHLSLHAPNDRLRKKLLPKAGPIISALESLQYFSEKSGQVSKVNYVLIKDVNDSVENATQLSKLLGKYDFTVKLSKLNPCNNFLPSPESKFRMFEKTLTDYGINSCRFHSAGTEINAGCGQFRISYKS